MVDFIRGLYFMTIGRIEREPLRNIWEHEAYDFTSWLEENIEVLSEELEDINLTNPESEQPAGNFSVDIVVEDENENIVVIENQLEKSDHNHLGKLLTYLSAFEAKIGIWIVSEARPEHISAVTWLNESTAADFYLFKIEAIKIGNSDPAPLFTLIVGPSEESKAVGKRKKEIAERKKIRRDFWEELLERAKGRTRLYSSVSATTSHYLATGAGKSGLRYKFTINQHTAEVQLYIDRGKDSQKENYNIFQKLKKHKAEIEKNFGEELNWEELEEKRACRISKHLDMGGYRDNEMWNDIQDNLIENMIRLEEAFSSYINEIA